MKYLALWKYVAMEPKDGIKESWVNHLFKYFDGRFNDPIFTAIASSQKQRHACLPYTALPQTRKRKACDIN